MRKKVKMVRVPEDLHQAVKAYSVIKNISLEDALSIAIDELLRREGLREVLLEGEKAGKREPRERRVKERRFTKK